MHSLFSNLTAVLLVIQAMFGCCRYHTHSEAECASVAAPSDNAHQCCGHCGSSHDEGGPATAPNTAPSRCEGECHGVCSYLPTPKTVIDASPANAALDFAVIVPMLFDGRLAAALLWDCPHAVVDSPPPLRLHLLHQILLI